MDCRMITGYEIKALKFSFFKKFHFVKKGILDNKNL